MLVGPVLLNLRDGRVRAGEVWGGGARGEEQVQVHQVQERPFLTMQGGTNHEVMREVTELGPEARAQVATLWDPGLDQDASDSTILREFKQLFGQVQANAILSSKGQLALYATISMVNHSCSPNAFWVARGAGLEVRVCREVAEAEEITASYLDIKAKFPTRQERRESLERERFFLCRCRLCCLEGEELEEGEEVRRRLRRLERAVEAACTTDVAQALDKAEEMVELMEERREEMVMWLPAALLQCCALAASAKVEGKVAEYRSRLLDLATTLGRHHRQFYEARLEALQ